MINIEIIIFLRKTELYKFSKKILVYLGQLIRVKFKQIKIQKIVN